MRGGRPGKPPPQAGNAARPRWPFPGTVELWVANENGVDELRFGTCLNLSPNGIGITTDFELEPGLELPLAIHQPEVSLHGRAAIRHCNEIESGYYMGLEFLFDAE